MNSRATTLVLVAMLAVSTAKADVSYNDVIAWLETNADAPTDGLAPSTYDVTRLSELARYIPPGYLGEFDFPELEVELSETHHYQPHPSYQKATKRFAGTATLDADGALKSYTAGLPFSAEQIDTAPADQAGYMLAWSHIFRWQHYGYETDILVSYVEPGEAGSVTQTAGMQGGGHVMRAMTMYYRRVYLSKLAHLDDSEFRLDVDDSTTLHWKEYMKIVDPFDVAGSQFVVERSLDPHEGDQVYSYLPTERRVRRLSAKERSDSFMGTEYTFDDLQGFSGRVMDYTWRYLGRKVVMHVSASRHKQQVFFGPMSHVPKDRWQLRPCYVVELIPKWKEHPYGRRIHFIDADTLNTAMSLIFDREDQLWKVIYTAYEREDTTEGVLQNASQSTHRWAALVGIDLKNRRSTISREPDGTQALYESISPAKVRRIFDVSNLTSGR
jgi:hypothetical protein